MLSGWTLRGTLRPQRVMFPSPPWARLTGLHAGQRLALEWRYWSRKAKWRSAASLPTRGCWAPYIMVQPSARSLIPASAVSYRRSRVAPGSSVAQTSVLIREIHSAVVTSSAAAAPLRKIVNKSSCQLRLVSRSAPRPIFDLQTGDAGATNDVVRILGQYAVACELWIDRSGVIVYMSGRSTSET